MRRRDGRSRSTRITWSPWTSNWPSARPRRKSKCRARFRSSPPKRTTSYVKTDTAVAGLGRARCARATPLRVSSCTTPASAVNDSGNYSGPGARQIDTYWTNDGIVEMQDLVGSGGSGIGPDIENVAEINYVLVNSPAEFKSATTITTVSKSGTNLFHGSLYYDYNGSRLNARNFFAATVPFSGLQRFCREHRRADQEEQDLLLCRLRGIAQRTSRGRSRQYSACGVADRRFQQSAGERQDREESVHGPALSEQHDPVRHDQSGLAESARLSSTRSPTAARRANRRATGAAICRAARFQRHGRTSGPLLQRAGHRIRALQLSPRADSRAARTAAARRNVQPAAERRQCHRSLTATRSAHRS